MNNTKESLLQLEAAKALILGSGLPMPPVPKSISDKIFRPSDANYFTSRGNAPGPWSLGWFLEEIEYGNPEDYIMLGMDGHGIESAATHFYLVEQDIAIFHQSQLVSPSNPEPEPHLSEQYNLMATMMVAITQAKRKDQLPDRCRLIIVRPTYRQSFWGVQYGPGQSIDWQDTGDALLDASGWLAEKMH